MDDIDELKRQLKKEKEKVAVLEKKLKLYEQPSPVRAYYIGQKILNQQIDLLNEFDLSTEIKQNPKEDKLYDRAMDLFEKLTANATKLNTLKNELSLSGNEQKDISNPVFRVTSPESMADSIGELAGSKRS